MTKTIFGLFILVALLGCQSQASNTDASSASVPVQFPIATVFCFGLHTQQGATLAICKRTMVACLTTRQTNTDFETSNNEQGSRINQERLQLGLQADEQLVSHSIRTECRALRDNTLFCHDSEPSGEVCLFTMEMCRASSLVGCMSKNIRNATVCERAISTPGTHVMTAFFQEDRGTDQCMDHFTNLGWHITSLRRAHTGTENYTGWGQEVVFSR